jgi:hypothetical protein
MSIIVARLVPFTIPEDMFFRLQPITTFAFGWGHNVKSLRACFKAGVAFTHAVY